MITRDFQNVAFKKQVEADNKTQEFRLKFSRKGDLNITFEYLLPTVNAELSLRMTFPAFRFTFLGDLISIW
jgi:hypothetical protein